MGMVTRQLQRLIDDVRRTGRLESLEAAAAAIRENVHSFGTSVPPDVLVDFAECTCALGHYDKAVEAIEVSPQTIDIDKQTMERRASLPVDGKRIGLTMIRIGSPQHVGYLLLQLYETTEPETSQTLARANLLRAAVANQSVERVAKERVHSGKPTQPSQPISDIAWRINLILQYASCLEDAGRIVDAFKATDDAVKLLAEDGPDVASKAEIHTERTVFEWKVMMARVTLARGSEPLVAVVRKEAEKHVWSRMQMTALFASRLPVPEAATGLAKSWALVDPDFFTIYSKASGDSCAQADGALETALAGLPAVTASANEQLAAGLLARTAMELNLWSLGSLMVKRLKRWKKLTSRCTLMQELLATELDVYLSECEQQPVPDQAVSAEEEERRMDASRARRVHAVKIIEECLVTAEQNPFCSDFREECCVSMWNMARPLLLEPSRSLVYRSLHRASETLENMESSLATLRVNLLYQVALCEAQEDLPAVAKESIAKALSIDYDSSSDPSTVSASVASGNTVHQWDSSSLREPAERRSSRGLDQYLKTLYESIRPQVVLDDEFVTLDQMQLLVDRIKSDLSLRNYLPKIETLKDQALAELAESGDKPANELHDPAEAEIAQCAREEKIDRLLRLMNHVAQQAYMNGQFSVAATFSKMVLRLTENRKDELAPILRDEEEKAAAERAASEAPPTVRLMVPAHNTQTAIAVVQSCYTLALCLSQILKTEYKELPGVDAGTGKGPGASTENEEFSMANAVRPAGHKKVAAKAMKMKQDIAQLLLVGTRLSKDFEQFWLVANGAIHFWNLHKHILESRAFDRTMNLPLLEHVQELQKDLLVKHEVFPATNKLLLQNLTLFHTQHALAMSNLTAAEEAVSRALPFLDRNGCKDAVASLFEGGAAACTSSPWIEQLLKTNVSNDASLAPTSSPLKAGKGAKQKASPPSALAELPSDLMGGEIRAVILMERMSTETDLQVKEGLITRCYDMIQAMPAETELARELQAEMKTRLAVRTFSAPSLFLRLSLAFALEAVGEDRQHVPYTLATALSRRKRLWLGISHAVAGLSLSSLHSDWSCPNAASCQSLALLHLLQACQCAKSTKNPSLALLTCQSLWNVVAALTRVEELRRDVINALRTALPIVGVANRSDALPTLVKMYLALLSCLCAEREWNDVVAVADKAFLQLPKYVHSQVLRLQLLAISKREKHPFEEIREKAASETASEGELLLFCARALPAGHADAKKLYARAIEVMEGSSDIKAAEAHLELANLFLLASEPWSEVAKHIHAALALADEADDMQRRCSLLKTFRGDKGGSSDGRQTSYIPELGFDIYQRAKTLALVSTPVAEEFLAALSDATSAIVERFANSTENAGTAPETLEDTQRCSAVQMELTEDRGNADVSNKTGQELAEKVLDIRDMAKTPQVHGDRPISRHPHSAPDSSTDPGESRLFHNSREHRRFENCCLTTDACRNLQNILFQLGLEAWAIPVLHRHAELLREADSNPGRSFSSAFLHLEQTLCGMRLARAFHGCESATPEERAALPAMSSVVDSTLESLGKLMSSLLGRGCASAHVPAAGREADATSSFYVERFQQASAAKLFADLAEEFYVWGESRAAFEFANAALQTAQNEDPTDPDVVVRAAGCLGALNCVEEADAPALAFLKRALNGGACDGASASTLAAVAETLALVRFRPGKSALFDDLLHGTLRALEEGDQCSRKKEPHRAGAKRFRSDLSVDCSRLNGEASIRAKISGETLLEEEEAWSSPVLQSLWTARLKLLAIKRAVADQENRLRVYTPADILDVLANTVLSEVQVVVDSFLASPLLSFILPHLVPLFVKMCDVAEILLQDPVGSAGEGLQQPTRAASVRGAGFHTPTYSQELDALLSRLRRMAAVIGDRIVLPSLRHNVRLEPPEMLSSLHQSVKFFGVVRARLERLSCYTQLLDPAYLTVSTCPMTPHSMCSLTGMAEFLTASREKSAVDDWLRKSARQLDHRAGQLKDARRLLRRALDSLSDLCAMPYQALKEQAEREIAELRRQVLQSVRGVGHAPVFSLNEMETSLLSEVALLNLCVAHADQEVLHMEKAGETDTEFVLQLWDTDILASGSRVRMEIEDYRTFLVEVSAVPPKGKGQAGNPPASRVPPWQGTPLRAPVESSQFSAALKEVENCFFYCLAARMYDRAKAIGHTLHTYGGGNTSNDSVERTFHSLTTLQALQTVHRAEWIHQSLSDPTVLENVFGDELRRLQKLWAHPAGLERVQQLEAKSPFWRAQNSVWQLTSRMILQQICPRQLCVVSLQCLDQSLYLAAALTLQGLEGGEGGAESVCYFVEKVALPPQLRMADVDSETPNPHIEAILVHLMKNLELKLHRASLYERAQAFQENRPSRECQPQHLLLLLDPCLVPFAFEKFDVTVKLFGSRVSRDYSLHFFAHRMLQAEGAFSTPNRRSVSDMNLSFAKESVIVLADPATEEGEYEERLPSSPTGQQKSNDQAAAAHDLIASDRPNHCARYTTEDFIDCICTQSPQVVWTPSIEPVLRTSISSSRLLALDLSHLMLIGTLDWDSHKAAMHGLPRRSSKIKQKIPLTWSDCDLVLLLSLQGVSAIVLNDYSSPEAAVRQGARTLSELLMTQQTLASIATSLEPSLRNLDKKRSGGAATSDTHSGSDFRKKSSVGSAAGATDLGAKKQSGAPRDVSADLPCARDIPDARSLPSVAVLYGIPWITSSHPGKWQAKGDHGSGGASKAKPKS
ncbi:conserved hypothetical protein [Neospora caninum Liverpool]|uniref:Uncharacterized protein n=1 Tax=Neospora caninum (strain Liverpool) TaxID=572307 RepID=F0VIM3_NEOCL|nr:conserved hypothetical protein [Neospora caninum Liverpool]CBZ53584.1 conserved hypothetical protein [Neospora caninum Liverpool]CEL67572.1 TPA: hypothetical protein BN1204_033710 [Neospora caninum Liverpool]|eukprot:XP_003883616.1 conserved hypothetical protein [Neospora caninum Liverpool]